MREKYLKSHQYYIDLYDKQTVESARRIMRVENKDIAKYRINEDEPEEVTLKNMKLGAEMYLYFENGERFRNKQTTIREWMNRDEKRDNFLELVIAPRDIGCLVCGRNMSVSSKHLEIGWDKKPDRVLFFYDCILNHVPRRAFFDNGEEWKRKPTPCPKCHADLGEQTTREESTKRVVTVSTCPRCNHIEEYVLDLSEKPKIEPEIDPDFAKDREKFCLSDEEGGRYISWMANMKEFGRMMEKKKEKDDNKELYEMVSKIKRLRIIDLESLLMPILEKEGFVKFHLKDPEIGKDVVVPFIVHDSISDREEKKSVYLLQNIVKESLKDTNWRLMSEGVTYCMGMLEARLRGYEKEEDLVKLMTK